MRKTLLLAAALLLAACQTAPAPAPRPAPPPVQPQSPAPVPVQPPKPATAGPLTPANVEHYMDGLERGLRGLLRAQNIRVARRGDALHVVLSDARLFSGGSLTPEGTSLIGLIARAIRYYDHTAALVNGYADNADPAPKSLAASQTRAKLVSDALAAAGVAAGRLGVKGLGDADPLIPYKEPTPEPRNRRIEIDITPKPE
jgi:outer membrane protein OmpA-like peptidoglycan-associated protein